MRLGPAIAAAAALLVAPAPASAALTLTEDTAISDTGGSFRALEIVDSSSARNQVILGNADAGQITISDPAGVANVPAGCTRTGPISVDCPRADYDIFFIGTGDGRDTVHAGIPYPSLTRKQIVGPAIFTPMNVHLGKGTDHFTTGSAGTDSIWGGPGKDNIRGGAANDFLVGGKGPDRVAGAGGTDYLLGGGGPDTLIAGRGVPDLMLGGGGRDRCVGADPKDRVASCEKVRLR
jgi:Ca2+-binding RTX toxin-like protein